MAGSTEMEMGSKNKWVWGSVTFAVSIAARAGIYWLMIGDVNDFSSVPVWQGAVVAMGALFPLLVYLAMYKKYSDKGKENPRGLHEIAKNNTWRMFAGGLAGIEIVFGVVITFVFPLLNPTDNFYKALGICCAVGTGVDIVLFLIGAACFKPDLIQVS